MDEPVGFVSGLAKKGRIVSFWNKTFVIDKVRHTVSTSAGQLQINPRDLSLVSPFLHQVVPYNGGLYLYFNRKLYYVCPNSSTLKELLTVKESENGESIYSFGCLCNCADVLLLSDGFDVFKVSFVNMLKPDMVKTNLFGQDYYSWCGHCVQFRFDSLARVQDDCSSSKLIDFSISYDRVIFVGGGLIVVGLNSRKRIGVGALFGLFQREFSVETTSELSWFDTDEHLMSHCELGALGWELNCDVAKSLLGEQFA